MTEPCDLSAVEARRLIGLKRLSPVELMESCLSRIDRVNGAVNAVVAIDRELAMTQAREAEEVVMDGLELGLLHGLPVGIKDLENTADLRTTYGSLLFKDNVPAEDDAMVANIRAAGGIAFCKTNTPEFGTGGNTRNAVYGATGNPFDPRLTAAGSSGGSAAALATGMMPLATGSDMGGSLRTPASYCGVVGFRPSPGLVPDPISTVSLSPFAVLGPMGRTVEDAHLLLLAQADIDRRDPYSSADAASLPLQLAGADLATIRAAISTDLGCAPVEAGIRTAFTRKMETIRGAFGLAEDRDPDMTGVHECFEVLRSIGFVAAFKEQIEQHRDKVGPNVIDNTERGLAYRMADVARAHVLQTGIYRRFLALFEDFDVLICPASSVSPFPHEQWYPQSIDGETMPTYMRWLALSYALTMALPAVCCIPAGLDHKGLPMGIQIAGPKGSDALVLEIAKSIEEALQQHAETMRPLPDLNKLEQGTV
jgi:Asp-tRNA(Asn)/Glu-tRNA(Gln) amidotransferase A subunit family amidase